MTGYPVRYKYLIMKHTSSCPGLGGELRSGKRLEERIREAKKMGYQRIIVPKSFGSARKGQAVNLKSSSGAAVGKVDSAVVECKTLFDALAAAFVNPEIAKAFSNRKSGKRNARFRGVSTSISNSNIRGTQAEQDTEDYSSIDDEM